MNTHHRATSRTRPRSQRWIRRFLCPGKRRTLLGSLLMMALAPAVAGLPTTAALPAAHGSPQSTPPEEVPSPQHSIQSKNIHSSGAITTASTETTVSTEGINPRTANAAGPVHQSTIAQAGQDISSPPLRTSRSTVTYTWPTGAPAVLLQDFDPPAQRWLAGHRGVDLALPAGSEVRSAAAGIVAFAGMVAGRPVVSIDHADGLRTTYEPVEPSVSAAQVVQAGEVIGILQPGHRSDGVDALHWGARRGRDTYVHPIRLIERAIIRLKAVKSE